MQQLYTPYQEWWRDRPNEARQPAYSKVLIPPVSSFSDRKMRIFQSALANLSGVFLLSVNTI